MTIQFAAIDGRQRCVAHARGRSRDVRRSGEFRSASGAVKGSNGPWNERCRAFSYELARTGVSPPKMSIALSTGLGAQPGIDWSFRFYPLPLETPKQAWRRKNGPTNANWQKREKGRWIAQETSPSFLPRGWSTPSREELRIHDRGKQARRTRSPLTAIARVFFIRRRRPRCHCFDVHNPRFIKHRPATLSSPTALCSPRVCSSLLIIPLPSGLFSRHAGWVATHRLASRVRVRTCAHMNASSNLRPKLRTVRYTSRVLDARLVGTWDLIFFTRRSLTILDDGDDDLLIRSACEICQIYLREILFRFRKDVNNASVC